VWSSPAASATTAIERSAPTAEAETVAISVIATPALSSRYTGVGSLFPRTKEAELRFELELDINRPPADVFEYLTDADKLRQWQEGALESRWEGEKAAGAHVKEVRKFMGKRVESDLEVTSYEPDRRFALKVVSGPVPFEVDHRLEAKDGGTHLMVVGEGEPGKFFKLAEPLMRRAAEKQMKGDFERLKKLLETGASEH
jgi:uncharacterized protein YndB with AHSA1/START domain